VCACTYLCLFFWSRRNAGWRQPADQSLQSDCLDVPAGRQRCRRPTADTVDAEQLCKGLWPRLSCKVPERHTPSTHFFPGACALAAQLVQGARPLAAQLVQNCPPTVRSLPLSTQDRRQALTDPRRVTFCRCFSLARRVLREDMLRPVRVSAWAAEQDKENVLARRRSTRRLERENTGMCTPRFRFRPRPRYIILGCTHVACMRSVR